MSTLSQLIHDKFISGNSVEVDRIVITRAEYEAKLAKPEQDQKYWLCCGSTDARHLEKKCTEAEQGHHEHCRYGTAKEHSDWQLSLAKPNLMLAPPPECNTDELKTAYAFGWYKALEVKRNSEPPRREWVGLTDAEKEEAIIACKAHWHSWAIDLILLCNYVDAKLKEKNT